MFLAQNKFCTLYFFLFTQFFLLVSDDLMFPIYGFVYFGLYFVAKR